jgi:hypothetical protein
MLREGTAVRVRIVVLAVALAFASAPFFYEALPTHASEDVFARAEVDTFGLDCDGDSAPAVVRTYDATGAPVPRSEVTLAFFNGYQGTVTDPATGEHGLGLTGVTDTNGEWHVIITPPAGTFTVVPMVVGATEPTPFMVGCPFPNDRAYWVQSSAFWDTDGNGSRGRGERFADDAQIGLASMGCCNWSQQIPPHWLLTNASGRGRWTGLWQFEQQHIWLICVPDGASYGISSVNGEVSGGDSCVDLPKLHEGRNSFAIGLTRR